MTWEMANSGIELRFEMVYEYKGVSEGWIYQQ